MLPSIGLVLSVEMIRDGGSLAAVFRGSNGSEYWLFFEHDSRALPSGGVERLGYKAPVVIERQMGLPVSVSWQQATMMLHQMRPLAPDPSSLRWLDVMEGVAGTQGKLPTGVERVLEPITHRVHVPGECFRKQIKGRRVHGPISPAQIV